MVLSKAGFYLEAIIYTFYRRLKHDVIITSLAAMNIKYLIWRNQQFLIYVLLHFYCKPTYYCGTLLQCTSCMYACLWLCLMWWRCSSRIVAISRIQLLISLLISQLQCFSSLSHSVSLCLLLSVLICALNYSFSYIYISVMYGRLHLAVQLKTKLDATPQWS